MGTNENITQEALSTRYEGLQSSDNTIAILLDTRALLTNIKNSLLGVEYDDTTETYIQTRQSLMAENGVHDYMRLLDSCIGIPQQLSGISEKEKKSLLRRILFTTIDFIYFNKVKYDIKESSFDTIYTIVDVNMTLFLNKSQSQVVIEFIKGIFGSRETIQKKGESKESEDSPQKGFSFFGGRR